MHCSCLICKIVISPKLAGYLAKKGFSLLPSAAINYITNIINQILSRRRQHLERRNDFIQIMVDHEKEIQDEEQTSQQTEKQEGRQWGTLSKSRNKLFSLS
jgi:siroheme synthase (precorrin-2 oxidase/ferrochelatase)